MHPSHWLHRSLALVVIGSWGISFGSASGSDSDSELAFNFELSPASHHSASDDDDGAVDVQAAPSGAPSAPISLQEFLDKYPGSDRDPHQVLNSLWESSNLFGEQAENARQLCSPLKAKHAPPPTEEARALCREALEAVSSTMMLARANFVAVLVFYDALQLSKTEIEGLPERLSLIEGEISALDRALPQELRLYFGHSPITDLPLSRDECRPPFGGVLSSPGLVCVNTIAVMAAKLVRVEELLLRAETISTRLAKGAQKLLKRRAYKASEASELQLARKALTLSAELSPQMDDLIGILRNPELDLTTMIFFRRAWSRLQHGLTAPHDGVTGRFAKLRAYFKQKHKTNPEIARLWDLHARAEKDLSIPHWIFEERFVADPELRSIAEAHHCDLRDFNSTTPPTLLYNSLGLSQDATRLFHIDETLINKWAEASEKLKTADELIKFLTSHFGNDLEQVEKPLCKNKPANLVRRYLRNKIPLGSHFIRAWNIIRSMGLFLDKLNSKMESGPVTQQDFSIQDYIEAYQAVAKELMEQAAFDWWEQKSALPLMDKPMIVRVKGSRSRV